jgi:hypothetical protein
MKRVLLAMAAGFVLVSTAVPSNAEENGKWYGKGVIVATLNKSVSAQDLSDHSLMLFECDGAVVNAEGKPFLDKARYQLVGLVDSTVGGHGYKTFTEADGSKVFAKYTVIEAKLPNILGKFEFTGGTGKYAGITGGGDFHVMMLSDVTQYDELHGEYRIPRTQ